MNRQFITKSLDPRASDDPLHVCKAFQTETENRYKGLML